MIGRLGLGGRWPARLRLAAALFFIAAGILHFIDPTFYREIIPPGFPDPALLVIVSGACEIAGGLGLIFRPSRRAAGWGLIALLVAVFPANVYWACRPQAVTFWHFPAWLLWVRLPFQAVFIFWVWYVALRRSPAAEAFPRMATMPAAQDLSAASGPVAAGFGPADKLMLAVVALYSVMLLAAWLILHFVADYRWWATVLLFAPRWIWSLPLAPLAIATILRRRPVWYACLLLLAIGALILADVHCPWRKLFARSTGEPQLRVMTCNCDSWSLRPDDFQRIVAEFEPDVIALQAVEISQLPKILAGSQRKWHVDVDGYLVLISRYPIVESENSDEPVMAKSRWVMRRHTLDVDGTRVQFFNIHLLSPRAGLRNIQTVGASGGPLLQAASNGRRRQAEIASHWIAEYRNVVVAGDFNTPPESPTYADNFNRLTNAFTSTGWGRGSTYFSEWFSLRIDHILCDAAWQPQGCWIGPQVGSEHRPVLALLAASTKQEENRKDAKAQRGGQE